MARRGSEVKTSWLAVQRANVSDIYSLHTFVQFSFHQWSSCVRIYCPNVYMSVLCLPTGVVIVTTISSFFSSYTTWAVSVAYVGVNVPQTWLDCL